MLTTMFLSVSLLVLKFSVSKFLVIGMMIVFIQVILSINMLF
jgi:hypothetical protein